MPWVCASSLRPFQMLFRTKGGTYILSRHGFLLEEVSHYKVTVAYSGTSPSLLIPFRVFKIDPSHTKHSQMIKWSRVFRYSVVTSLQNSLNRSRSLHMAHRPNYIPHYEMLLSGKYFPFNFGTQIPGFRRAFSHVMGNFAVERNRVRVHHLQLNRGQREECISRIISCQSHLKLSGRSHRQHFLTAHINLLAMCIRKCCYFPQLQLACVRNSREAGNKNIDRNFVDI